MILLGQRLIKFKQDRGPHPELCQRKHGQNVGKVSVDAKVGLPQGMDEDSPDHKVHQDGQQLSADRADEVIQGVGGPGFGKVKAALHPGVFVGSGSIGIEI